MSHPIAGAAMLIILLLSIASAVYDGLHRDSGPPGVYMPGPHGTALPGM